MKLFNLIKIIVLVFIIEIFISCANRNDIRNYPEFKKYATKSEEIVLRLPVVFVPGIKGSVLKKNEKIIWGHSWRNARIKTFDALKLNIEPQLAEHFNGLKDKRKSFSKYYKKQNFRDVSVLDEFVITIPGLQIIQTKIYKEIIEFLKEKGGYTEEVDLFKFSYDWRLDNRIAALELSHEINRIQQLYEDEYILRYGGAAWEKFIVNPLIRNLITEDGKIKVNIVAHSMGGLVARYYLQILNGYKNTESLILFGTPNKGAMDTIKVLKYGEYPEVLLFNWYSKEETKPIIFSWASIFQLLPRYHNAVRYSNEDTKKTTDLGLSYDKVESDFYGVVNNWRELGLIPKLSTEEDKIKDKYLFEQLVRSKHFYRAINGKCGDKTNLHMDSTGMQQVMKMPEKKEKEILDMFISYYHETNKSGYKPIVNCTEGQIPIRFVIFGGNCEQTQTYAKITNKHTKKEIEFTNDPEKLLEKRRKIFGRYVDTYTQKCEWGDGRVPIVSLLPEGRERDKDTVFILCNDHVEMVKNPIFQYNCLRELLWPTNKANKLTF